VRWVPLGVAAGVALTVAPAAGQAPPEGRRPRDSGVVGQQVTYQLWEEDGTWAKRTPGTRTANAVLLDQTHLLTTAQMLSHATLVSLITLGRARPVEPRPVLIDPDVNLALLEVDETAVADLEPVPLAERTPTEGVLRTVRWRGQQLESAASRVTRFEVERSLGSRIEYALLRMVTDLTGGGWAEPVLDGGKLVGLTVSQSEQVSRAVPVEILRAFLERAREPEAYTGFPAFGALWQVNRDAAVTGFLGQSGDPAGVIIRQVPWGSSACGVLRPRDILLQLDGHDIDAEGFYRHRHFGQIRFTHLLAEGHVPGDEVPVSVLREGQVIDLRMTLRAYPTALDLIPNDRIGPPPYVVAGGLVLRELDVPYLRTWGQEWSKNGPLPLLTRFFLEQEGQTAARRRFVLLTAVLPTAYTLGYEGLRDAVVERINGREIGRITGRVDVEDVLDAIFAEFCIGK